MEIELRDHPVAGVFVRAHREVHAVGQAERDRRVVGDEAVVGLLGCRGARLGDPCTRLGNRRVVLVGEHDLAVAEPLEPGGNLVAGDPHLPRQRRHIVRQPHAHQRVAAIRRGLGEQAIEHGELLVDNRLNLAGNGHGAYFPEGVAARCSVARRAINR